MVTLPIGERESAIAEGTSAALTAGPSSQGDVATEAIIPIITEFGLVAISMLSLVVAVLALMQNLKSHQKSQRNHFLSEHAMKFFSNREFLDTYHYLVYTYSAGRFNDVEKQVNHLVEEGMELLLGITDISKMGSLGSLFKTERRLKELQEEMFRLLANMQDGRGAGFRFYHPRLFQGSVEDSRLDALLGYFNSVAHHYYENKPKSATLADINSTIGHHIIVTVHCRAVADYLNFIEWLREVNPRFDKFFGESGPFSHLKKLSEDLVKLRTSRAP